MLHHQNKTRDGRVLTNPNKNLGARTNPNERSNHNDKVEGYPSLCSSSDPSRSFPLEFCHSYTYVDHILIEILFSHPINILQIFELLFHGHICYEY
jgi:hypothetical protein